MVFQIAVDAATEPIYDRDPTRVDRVLIAKLRESDWNFSGRGAGSRRTPTASINQPGERSLSAAPSTSAPAVERRKLRDRRPGDGHIGRVDLHADASVPDRLRSRQRRARPRERVQHDALPQRQGRPHDLTQERLRLEAGVLRDRIAPPGAWGPESITSPNGRSAEMRRNPPTPHLRRLSWTRPSSGLRNVSHGSHIERGMTLTPGNSSCAFLGRSPPRIVITRRTISPRRSNPASVTAAATRYETSGFDATSTFAPGTRTGYSARAHSKKNDIEPREVAVGEHGEARHRRAHVSVERWRQAPDPASPGPQLRLLPAAVLDEPVGRVRHDGVQAVRRAAVASQAMTVVLEQRRGAVHDRPAPAGCHLCPVRRRLHHRTAVASGGPPAGSGPCAVRVSRSSASRRYDRTDDGSDRLSPSSRFHGPCDLRRRWRLDRSSERCDTIASRMTPGRRLAMTPPSRDCRRRDVFVANICSDYGLF